MTSCPTLYGWPFKKEGRSQAEISAGPACLSLRACVRFVAGIQRALRNGDGMQRGIELNERVLNRPVAMVA